MCITLRIYGNILKNHHMIRKIRINSNEMNCMMLIIWAPCLGLVHDPHSLRIIKKAHNIYFVWVICNYLSLSHIVKAVT